MIKKLKKEQRKLLKKLNKCSCYEDKEVLIERIEEISDEIYNLNNPESEDVKEYLQKELKEQEEKENYERCAEIRDELKKIK